jgi:peptide/nickel transport system permease protein
VVVFPALAVMTAVLSFNLLGDAWRDWLDPRTRSQMAAQEFSR